MASICLVKSGTPGCGFPKLSAESQADALKYYETKHNASGNKRMKSVFGSAAVACQECGCTLKAGDIFTWSTSPSSASATISQANSQPEPTISGTNSPTSEMGLLTAIAGAVSPIVINEIRKQNLVNEDRLTDLVESLVQDAIAQIPSRKLDVTINGKVNRVNGYRHAHFEPLMRLSALRMDTLIYGPAGGGKTTVIKQISEAYGKPYFAMSLDKLATRTVLVGYQSQDGTAVGTQFKTWFMSGGVLALEEVGAASGNLAVSLNTALDNGICSFPGDDEPSNRHADSVLIATDNSNLSGADQLYNGRQAQDAAFRERFAFWKWEYDERLEELVALGGSMLPATHYDWTPTCDQATWVRNVFALRRGLEDEKLTGRVVISPRASIKGSTLVSNGFPACLSEDMVIWKGLDVDTIARIRRAACNHGYIQPSMPANWMTRS